jgi:C4-type Zn-finger protein
MMKLLCILGFHKFIKRSWFFGEIVIEGRVCKRCDYSPTWER